MSTKHQPATPLPWQCGVKRLAPIIYDEIGWGVANAISHHGLTEEEDMKANAAYIAHACNAYPKLIEQIKCLRDALYRTSEYAAAQQQAQAAFTYEQIKHPKKEFHTWDALLQELGEL